MNQKARDVLIEGALRGVPQKFGDGGEGAQRCVVTLLGEAVGEMRSNAGSQHWVENHSYVQEYFGLKGSTRCSECGYFFAQEWDLLIHLNDIHFWDFLAVARKGETPDA